MRGGGAWAAQAKALPYLTIFSEFLKNFATTKIIICTSEAKPAGILTSRIFCYRAKITLDFSFYIG
jgi:hypothetical protein